MNDTCIVTRVKYRNTTKSHDATIYNENYSVYGIKISGHVSIFSPDV